MHNNNVEFLEVFFLVFRFYKVTEMVAESIPVVKHLFYIFFHIDHPILNARWKILIQWGFAPKTSTFVRTGQGFSTCREFYLAFDTGV